MANWKKIIVSGSNAHLSSVTASNGSIISGSLTLTGSLNITGSIAYPENIDFDTTPTSSLSSTVEGRLSWNNGTRALVAGAGNSVDIQLGQSEWAYVYNAEATTLSKGEVVYVSGSQGNTLAVKRAVNTGDQLSAGTLGVVGESIASGAEGLIIVNGLLKKLNTSTLTAGAVLYLGSTPGTYSQTVPTAPSHSVRIGYVVKVDTNQGEIYVKVDNGYELGELHDIVDTTTTSSYGDLLVKSGSVWKNTKELTGSYIITGSLRALSFTGSLQGTASNAVSSSYAVSASYAATSSFAITASFAQVATLAQRSALTTNIKSGQALAINFAFNGVDWVYPVVFQTSYANANYAVSITGQDPRAYTVAVKGAGGFTINTNSNIALVNDVDWTAIPHYDP